MGKKEKRLREIKRIASSIQKNETKVLREKFKATREQAIEDSKAGFDWYSNIRNELVSPQNSKSASVFIELEDKTHVFLNALKRNDSYINDARRNLITVIAQSQDYVYEQISTTGAEFADRFYLQEILIDMSFAKASKAEHALDLIGMYYDMLSEWNEGSDDDSDSSEFLRFYGNDAYRDVIARTWEDIQICNKVGKFSFSESLGKEAHTESKHHIIVLVDEINKLRSNGKKSEEPSGSTDAAGTSGGKSSTKNGVGTGGQAGKKQTRKKNDDQPDKREFKKGSDDVQGNGVDIEKKQNSGFIYRHFGAFIIVVVAGLILAGCLGYMIGFNAGKNSILQEQQGIEGTENPETTADPEYVQEPEETGTVENQNNEAEEYVEQQESVEQQETVERQESVEQQESEQQEEQQEIKEPTQEELNNGGQGGGKMNDNVVKPQPIKPSSDVNFQSGEEI